MLDLNRIYHGDCLEVMKEIPDKSIDLTVTSPPYDNLRTYGGSWEFDFEGIAKQLFRITKDGGVVVWVVGDATINGSETGTSFRQALGFIDVGFNLHDTMIYYKNGPPYPDKTRYQQVFEYMFVLSVGKPKAINLIVDRKNRWAGCKNFGTRTNRNKNGEIVSSTLANRVVSDLGTRWNVWEIETGFGYSSEYEEAFQHPAIFPEKLATDHVLSWSNSTDAVLDPFMGSGTTAIACIRTGRNYIGIEKEAKYVEIAEKRIKNELAQLKLAI